MRFRLLTTFVTGAAFLFACTAASPTKKKRTPADPGDFIFDEDPTEEQPLGTDVDPTSGAFGAPERPSKKDASAPADAGNVTVDAGDAGPPLKTYCQGPIAAGDLVFTELMINARAGSADDGEWVEVTSTKSCWLKLDGVSVESPRGAIANAVTLDGELAPNGTFVVAGSADPAKNHGLPGKVYAWEASDVLKNDGDTVRILFGGAVVDSLTYPSFSNLEPGRSVAFPSDCPAASRTDWLRWSLAFDAWNGPFKGTPNAENADVACF